jgi:16S rRNA processing protein RimM
VEQSGLVEIGRVVKPHGLKGEVVVELVTDREERLAPGNALQTDRGQVLAIESARLQRPGNDRRRARWVVHFEGFATVEAAGDWRDVALLAEPLDDPGELWAHELVGSQVVLPDGSPVGRCHALIANPAADLLELDGGALVPVVFVTDHGPGRIVIDPPEGLLDL